MSRQLDRGRETLMDIFHRHQQAGDHSAASVALERALQVPTYRPEALVWKGIAALPQTPELAFLFFAEASKALPERADIHALVGRSLLAQGHPSLATRYLTDAWKTQPNDLALRLTLWEARSRSQTPTELRRMILAHLPDIHGGKELGLVLKLLAEQADAPRTVGVVRYVPEQKEIQGWAIDLQSVQTPVALRIEVDGKRIDTVANAIHPLLKAAGLPETHGGIRVSVPNPTPSVQMLFADGTPLLGSPLYAMPAFVPPPPAAPSEGVAHHVDVLIPVYDGLAETLECINSALEARKLNRTPHRLVVIEDKTPVPALAKALKVLAAKGKITLIQNKVNLGFIRSMNRGMALSPNKDVIWLNADTRVHGAWIDRLHAVAYSASDIASVTPFTNNGELMSFPRSQICHDMPDAKAHAELDDLARQVGSTPVEIETGCGFCLYIKRTALDQVGYLDEVHLARGYGEETDWCLRARAQGWRHMGAPSVFVAHQGGISFGIEKVMRVAQNNAVLRQRYPHASTRYKKFCLRDPIKPARQALQKARLERLTSKSESEQNKLWPINANQHLQIHDGSSTGLDFSLSYHHDSHRTWVVLTAPLRPLQLCLEFELPYDFDLMVDSLRKLPLQGLVFQQLARCPAELCDLPTLLDLPYQIVCSDDRLLCKESDYDWERFACEATAVKIPWEAVRSLYTDALPGACVTSAEKKEIIVQAVGIPKVLLIGDKFQDIYSGPRWLVLARRIRREQLPIRLLVLGDGPVSQQLKDTGTVYVLPEQNCLSLAERAQVAGCTGILSLATDPGCEWFAPTLAAQLDLPLFAFPSKVASEVGATALTSLFFSSSLDR